MITISESDGVLDIQLHVRPPMVYLDNWAISRVLANDGPRRERFIEIFRSKGTLLFSWANVIELPLYENIPVLLDGVGENWFPVEWNPFACMRKENAQDAGGNTPALSETFVLAYSPHIHGERLTLSSMLELLRSDDPKPRRAMIKKAAKQMVDDVKSFHAADPHWLDREHPALPFDPKRPTQYVFTQLLRMLALEPTFSLNDGMDLFHATVPHCIQ